MEIANIKQGKVDRIVNTEKKGNEAEVYHRVWVEDEGELSPLFLTDRELDTIKNRTAKNREDWIDRGWIIKLKDDEQV